ncbi:hypothetical protein ACNKHK_21945 [Shigella flexneri]
MFRGRNEGVLKSFAECRSQLDEPPKESHGERIIRDHLGLRTEQRAGDGVKAVSAGHGELRC